MPPEFRHRDYEILESIGAGGMGRVYRAIDRRWGRPVALKVVELAVPGDRERGEREVRLLDELKVPGLPRILDVGRIAGGTGSPCLYFAMELIEGTPWGQELSDNPTGAERARRVASVALEVARILAAVHARGVVHGDLKPANVLLSRSPVETRGAGEPSTSEGSQSRPSSDAPMFDARIIDFGVARAVHRQETATIAGEGTLLYMAPEQREGADFDHRADLHALGATIYHLIARTPPFASLQDAIARKPPRSLIDLEPDCPPALASLVSRLLSPRPEDRPANAAEVIATLESLLATRVSGGLARKPRLYAPVFVGRKRELETLDAALERAASGRITIATIEGAPDAGKTWLVFRSRFRTEAFFEHDAILLRSSIGADGRQDSLEAICDELQALGFAIDPGAPRVRLGTEPDARASSLIVAAARERVVVLVVEDVVPDEDVGWLADITRATPSLRLLIILTTAEVGSTKAESISPRGDALRIRLDAFTDRDIASYVESVLSPSAPASNSLVELLRDRAPNSLAAAHRLIDALVRDDALFLDGAGAWQSSLDPRSGAATEGTELEALDDRRRKVLAAVALLGRTFESAALAQLAPAHDQRESRVRSDLDHLIAGGYLRETPDGLEAARGDVVERLIDLSPNPAPLRLLCRRAAEWFDAHDEGSRLSRELHVARILELSGFIEESAQRFLDAGRIALGANTHASARLALSKAVELTRKDDSRFEALVLLADLETKLGNYVEALSSLDEAGRAATLARGPHAVVRRLDLDDRTGRVHQKRRDLDRAAACFTRALEDPSTPMPQRSRALARVAGVAFDRQDFAGAQRLYTEALEAIGNLGAAELRVEVLTGLGLIAKQDGRVDEAISNFEAALEVARRSQRPLDAATLLNNIANLRRTRGDLAGSIECFERSIELREEAGDPRGLAICLNNLARVQYVRGELSASERTTRRALETFERVGDAKGILIAGYNLAEALFQRSAFAEALSTLDGVESRARALDAKRILASAARLRGRVALERCSYSDAEDWLLRALSLAGDETSTPRTRALADLAELHVLAHRGERAEEVLRDAEEASLTLRDPEAEVAVAIARMRERLAAGELDEARELGERILGRSDGSIPRLDLAVTRRELGTVYRELGPDWADKTERHLETAIDETTRMGSRHETAEALGRLALYWHYLGETAIAAELFERARSAFIETGLEKRARSLSKPSGS
jgi:tetratricopeptide (TPR) repeat protein